MGIFLIIGGIIFLLFSLAMDTTVHTALGTVHNIGLLNERQNYTIISSIIILIGVILQISSRKKTEVNSKTSTNKQLEEFDTKKCPYCAEIIKVEAKVCRYCGKDQPIENPEIHSETVKGNYRVKIKGSGDPKNTYLIAKEFYKDAGVTFEKAKSFLSSGTILNFENKDEALVFFNKYKEMGCEVELIED